MSANTLFPVHTWVDQWIKQSLSENPGNPQLEVDVRSSASGMILEMDVPGLSREDIEIHVENRILTIRAQRPSPLGEGEQWVRRERKLGKWDRSFRMAEDLDLGQLKAKLHQGVLKLEIPKSEASLSRRIEID